MYGKGLLEGLAVTIKNFFRKKITENYPETMPDLPERYHGSFDFIAEKCTICGICARVCPNQVITIGSRRDENNKRFLVSYEMDIQYCLFCGYCVEGCPTAAIVFNKDFELSVYSREDVKLNLWQLEKSAGSTEQE